MGGQAIIYWLVILLVVHPWIRADNPVDHQRKILVRMFWPGAAPQLQDTSQQIIPAASFSRQMIIRFPSSGTNLPTNKAADYVEPVKIPSSGNDALIEDVDYPLDSYVSLSLSSGGRDAEGAEKSSRGSEPEESASKLDLLQQLLRLAPAAVESGSYDKCNHPFHSWLCSKGETRTLTTTNPPPSIQQPEFFSGASFEDVQIFVPDVATPTLPPATTTIKAKIQTDPWVGMDPCSHPFHSWMCKPKPKLISPPESREPGASKLDENLLLPPTEATTTASIPTTTPLPPPTTTIRQKSGWDGVDPCTHPFHSWLCRPPPARTTLAPTPRTTPPTTTFQPFIPDASFFIPDVNPLPIPTTTTIPLPTTTERPFIPPTTITPPSILIRTLAPKKGWDEADSCSHPFHSWLCAKPKPRTTQPPPPPPPPPPPTTTTTTTTTPTTTTTTPPPPPPPEEAVIFEPAPSNDQGNQLVPDVPPPVTTTTPKPIKSGWDEADSCSHPFHSWLCAKVPGRTTTTRPPPTTTTTQPPTTTPLPPVDIQVPDASNFGNLETIPVVEEATPAPKAASGWNGADPCTHAFHSWLCNRSPSIKNSLRIGRQSAFQPEPDALLDEVLESARWENFESLKLLPSSERTKSS